MGSLLVIFFFPFDLSDSTLKYLFTQQIHHTVIDSHPVSGFEDGAVFTVPNRSEIFQHKFYFKIY